MPTLRSQLIRLAHAKPELRPHLLPLVASVALPAGAPEAFKRSKLLSKFQMKGVDTGYAEVKVPSALAGQVKDAVKEYKAKGYSWHPYYEQLASLARTGVFPVAFDGDALKDLGDPEGDREWSLRAVAGKLDAEIAKTVQMFINEAAYLEQGL